jgi:hypothetical protein
MHALVTEHDPVAELQAVLQARGIAMEVEGADLKVRGRPGALTPELRTAIQTHKQVLLAALTGFAPLDRAIIRSTAARHTSEQIQDRLAHAREMAAQQPASPLWHQAVQDWLVIAREQARLDASRPPDAPPIPVTRVTELPGATAGGDRHGGKPPV